MRMKRMAKVIEMKVRVNEEMKNYHNTQEKYEFSIIMDGLQGCSWFKSLINLTFYVYLG